MEQARHDGTEPTTARFQALVAEIVPKLRRLGPQLSEQTLLQTAERLAAHRLASEEQAAVVAGGPDLRGAQTYPSFPVEADGVFSPLDDARVRQLAVSFTHRLRPVSQHLSEGELVALATRMAVLEANSPATPAAGGNGNGSGTVVPLSSAPSHPLGGGSGSGSPPGGEREAPYDSVTVTAVAELYARADAALTTYPWLGIFAGASLGYAGSVVAGHALDLRVDAAVTTSIVMVLFGSTIGLLLGRAKGNIESHRLREEARATLAAADRQRDTPGRSAV